jgi:hypothetical protein
MADLAMLVAAIFVVVLISGPLAVLFASNGMPIMGGLLGVLAVLSGAHWQATAPSGVGLLGAASAILGLVAIGRAFWGIDR